MVVRQTQFDGYELGFEESCDCEESALSGVVVVGYEPARELCGLLVSALNHK